MLQRRAFPANVGRAAPTLLRLLVVLFHLALMSGLDGQLRGRRSSSSMPFFVEAQDLNKLTYPVDFAAGTTTLDGIQIDQLVVTNNAFSAGTDFTIKNSQITEIVFAGGYKENVKISILNCNLASVFFDSGQAFLGTTQILVQDTNFTHKADYYDQWFFVNRSDDFKLSLFRIRGSRPASSNFDITITGCRFTRHVGVLNLHDPGYVHSPSVIVLKFNGLTPEELGQGMVQSFGTVAITDNFFNVTEVQQVVSVDLSSSINGNRVDISRNAFLVHGVTVASFSLTGGYRFVGAQLVLAGTTDVALAARVGTVVMDSNRWDSVGGNEERRFSVLGIFGRIGGASLISACNNVFNRTAVDTRVYVPETRTHLIDWNADLAQNIDAIRVEGNWAHYNVNTKLKLFCFYAALMRSVKLISVVGNFMKSTIFKDVAMLFFEIYRMEDVSRLVIDRNEAHTNNSVDSMFLRTVNDAVLVDLHPLDFCRDHVKGICDVVPPPKQRALINTLEITNNRARLAGLKLCQGVYGALVYENSDLIRFADNEFNVTVYAAHDEVSLDTAITVVQCGKGFRNVRNVVLERNRGVLSYSAARNIVGIFFVTTANSDGIESVIIRNNNVKLHKSRYNISEVMSAGISFLNSDGKLLNVGSIQIVDNNIEFLALDKCPLSYCMGVNVGAAGTSDGIGSILVARNNIVITTRGSGNAGFSLMVASDGDPFQDLSNRKLRIYSAYMTNVGAITVAENRLNLSDTDRVLPFRVTLSGEVQVRGKFLITNNRILPPSTASSFPSEALFPLMSAGILSIGCPSAYAEVSVMGMKLSGTLACFDKSEFSVRDFEFSNLVVPNSRTSSFPDVQALAYVASSVTGNFTLRNISWSSDMSDFNPAFLRSSPHFLSDDSRKVFGLSFEERGSPQVAVRVINVTLSMRSSCARTQEQSVNTKFTDRVAFGLFPKLTGLSSVYVENTRVSLDCFSSAQQLASSSSSSSHPHVALFSFTVRPLRVTVANSLLTTSHSTSSSSSSFSSSPLSLAPTAMRTDLVSIITPAQGDGPTSTCNLSSASVWTLSASGDDTLVAAADARPVAGIRIKTLLTCLRWNDEVVVSYKFAAARGSIGDVEVRPCHGFEASRTYSPDVSLSRTVLPTASHRETLSRSRSADPPPAKYGLDKDTLNNLESASQIGTAVATVIGNNPGALLAAARGSVMLRLAMCRMADVAAARTTDRDEFFANHTRERMHRQLDFPVSLIPGFNVGSAAGASLRAAVIVDIVLLFLFGLLTLFLGSLNKQEWVKFVLSSKEESLSAGGGSSGGSRKKKKGHHHSSSSSSFVGDDNDDDSAAVVAQLAADAASDMSIIMFTPFDKMFLKVIILMMPNLAHLCGSLVSVQPGGGGDVAVALVPLLLITTFVASCWYYVNKTVSVPPEVQADLDAAAAAGAENDDSHQNEIGDLDEAWHEQQHPYSKHNSPLRPLACPAHAARSGSSSNSSFRNQQYHDKHSSRSSSAMNHYSKNNSSGQQRGSLSSPQTSLRQLVELEEPLNNPNSPRRRRREEEDSSSKSNKNKKKKKKWEPEFWTEESTLYFPLGASSDFQHMMHRGLQHPVARFALVGNHTWHNPYIMMKRNGQIVPGPGPLTMFGYIFNTYKGNIKRPLKKARRAGGGGDDDDDDDDGDDLKLIVPDGGEFDDYGNNGNTSSSSRSKQQRRTASRSSSSRRRGNQHHHRHHHHPGLLRETEEMLSAAPQKTVFETSWKHRFCTCWIFYPVLSTMACMGLSGIGDAMPGTCYSLFWIALCLTAPSAILSLWLRPYLVPLRSVSNALLDTSTFVSGLIFAALMAEGSEIDLSSNTIILAQLLSTLPGSIIGPGVSVFAITRVIMLRIGTSKVVTKTALREHLPHELDVAEERLLHPERFANEKKKTTYFGFDSSWFFED